MSGELVLRLHGEEILGWKWGQKCIKISNGKFEVESFLNELGKLFWKITAPLPPPSC